MSSTHRPARRSARIVSTCAISAGLFVGLGAPALADPTPVIPSAGEVAAAKAAAGDAASQVAALDAQLSDARTALSAAQDRAELAGQAYDAAREELDRRTTEASDAATRAAEARTSADQSSLVLSQYAAEVFQGGGGLGQLDVFFGGNGPQDVLDRASGVQAVGDERARMMQDAAAAKAIADNTEQVAAEARDRQAQAAAAVQAAAAQAQADADHAQAAAAALATQTDQATARMAVLRNTSVELEKQRQDGLAALERARIEAENRRRAEEAARAAAAKAAAEKAAAEKAAAEKAAAAKAAAERAAAQSARAAAAKAAAAASSGSGSSTSGTSTTSAGTSGSTTTTTNPPAPSGGVAAVIAFARAQMGEPYVWGAAGPGSWDCSGLTMMAWRQAGVSLGHYTGTQWAQTSRVPLAELRPGDLVFFGSAPGAIHHVGLYIGNGQMIHAPHTGDVVKISSIYYSSDLIPYGGRP